MVITIDPEKIYHHQISLDEFYYLYCLYLKESTSNRVLSENSINKLTEKGFIKIFEGNVILRPAFSIAFGTMLPTADVNSWIEEWRNLFPTIKISSRPAKGSKQSVLTKMNKFVKQHPEYTKEQIMAVTKMYIFEKTRENFKFMQCADYFIEKNGMSSLESLLEYHATKETQLEQAASSNSGFFQKNI